MHGQWRGGHERATTAARVHRSEVQSNRDSGAVTLGGGGAIVSTRVMRASIREGFSPSLERHGKTRWLCGNRACAAPNTRAPRAGAFGAHMPDTRSALLTRRARTTIGNRSARAPLLPRFTASTLAANWVVSCRRVAHSTDRVMELTWWCLHARTPHCSAKRNNLPKPT